MTEDIRGMIQGAFPELEEIESESLRSKTIDAWEVTMRDTSCADLERVPWRTPEQRRLGIPLDAESLVTHVRNVTLGAMTLVDICCGSRSVAVDRDVVVSGGLLHDVSKLYEFDEQGETAIGDLLGHPYFGVYIGQRVGLPVEVLHIILSHTRTLVEPATVEAAIVRYADAADASVIRSQAVDDLRDS